MEVHMRWLLGYMGDLNLWDFHDDHADLLWALHCDCRTLWGNNLLLSWAPKNVKAPMSVENMFPIAMAKWEGSEKHDTLKEFFSHVPIKQARLRIIAKVRFDATVAVY
jgi:hypothetical protein